MERKDSVCAAALVVHGRAGDVAGAQARLQHLDGSLRAGHDDTDQVLDKHAGSRLAQRFGCRVATVMRVWC